MVLQSENTVFAKVIWWKS